MPVVCCQLLGLLYSNIKNLELVRFAQRHFYAYNRINGHSFAHQLYENDSSFFISYQKPIDFFKHFWLNLGVYIWLFNVFGCMAPGMAGVVGFCDRLGVIWRGGSIPVGLYTGDQLGRAFFRIRVGSPGSLVDEKRKGNLVLP